MICVGCKSVCRSSTTASKTRLPRSVPGTVIAFSPVHCSDSRLYQLTPRPQWKYFGFAAAGTLRTGTTKRMPSA